LCASSSSLRRRAAPANDQVNERLALFDPDRMKRALQRAGQLIRAVDALAIATIMTVTVTCDHRVVDGALGAAFLKAFKSFLEDPMAMLL